jgi:hypothetical protein
MLIVKTRLLFMGQVPDLPSYHDWTNSMDRSIGLPANKIFSCETDARWAGETKMPGWRLDGPNRVMAEAKARNIFPLAFPDSEIFSLPLLSIKHKF